MSDQTSSSIKLGDRVKIHYSNLVGRVVELRGPLGPKGVEVYRVRLRGKPPSYIEVLEEQLEVLPAKSCSEQPSCPHPKRSIPSADHG